MENGKAFKRKMLLWTSTWSQEEPQHTTDKVRFTPDAVEIARLLLATGFRVRFMDRCLPKQMHPVPEVPADSPACRVIIMCPRSGLRMELDAPTTSCKCPSPNSSLGSSWTVSEAGSTLMDEAVNSTIPQLSNEISKSVAELIEGLFHVTNLFPDENHNDTKVTVQSILPPNLTSQQSEPANSAKSANVDRSPTKTPATGIAVVTPNAPCVPKLLPGETRIGVPGRYRSLDTLIASGGFPDDLPEPGQLTPKAEEPEAEMEIDGDSDSTIVGSGSGKKMFISKSSPAMHYTEQFQRSDTFVFGDAEGNDVTNENGKRMLIRSNTYVADGAEEEPRAGPPPQRIPGSMVQSFSQSVVLSKLQDLQKAISEIIFMIAGNERGLSSIGEVSKASKAVANAVQQQITDNVRPIRCLSDFGSVPNLSRAATTIRSIPRPNIRRYATTIAAPATPTTSRRGNTASLHEQMKRGSSTTLSVAGASGKAATSPRSSVKRLVPSAAGQQSSISPSSASTSSSSKLAASRRLTNVHSSIPKPSTVARK